MLNNERLKFISDHCDIYYDGMLISKERVLRDYALFLASNDKRIRTALHTGSICFDVLSVVYLIFSLILKSVVSNDDIISTLKPNDMVIFQNKRQRWLGITEENGIRYVHLEEDGSGLNGNIKTTVAYERVKSLIKPYYGDSTKTGGTGVIKSNGSNRNDFLAKLLNVDAQEIPSSYDFQLNVLAPKEYFENIFAKTIIKYDNGKVIFLPDLLLPLSYYTRNGEERQIGGNQTKSSPNICYTERTAIVRDLVMDNRESSVLVLKEPFDTEGYSELDDFLRLTSLDGVLLSIPLNSGLSVHLIESNLDSSIYGCTKKHLAQLSLDAVADNSLTRALSNQLNNIANQNIVEYDIASNISVESYAIFRQKLKRLRWNSDKKNEFQRYAFSVLKLFSSAFFTMSELETAISSDQINMGVLSPGERIKKIKSLASDSQNEDCLWLADELEKMYERFFEDNPKKETLKKILEKHSTKKVLLVVSKSYYIDIFNLSEFATDNVSCTTIDRFDSAESYDVVIALSGAEGKRFSPMNCSSARNLYVLLYDYEKRLYDLLSKKHSVVNKKIEAKIEGKSLAEVEEITKNAFTRDEEKEINEAKEIDTFLENLYVSDVVRIASSTTSGENSSQSVDISYAGLFTSGESILFTKNYRSVVFNQDTNVVEEKSVEDLAPGDLLIFMKKDDYTKNIVDYLFDSLLEKNKLSDAIPEAYKMSKYWKESLIHYKEKNKASYRRIMWEFSKLGSSLREVTIRQWLMEDSHVVGPRDIGTMEKIAKITGDEKLLENPQKFFDACKIIRAQRVEILKLISRAINDRFNGNYPEPGSILEIVYENVEKLSITLELEKIMELPTPKSVNPNIANKPLTQL